MFTYYKEHDLGCVRAEIANQEMRVFPTQTIHNSRHAPSPTSILEGPPPDRPPPPAPRPQTASARGDWTGTAKWSDGSTANVTMTLSADGTFLMTSSNEKGTWEQVGRHVSLRFQSNRNYDVTYDLQIDGERMTGTGSAAQYTATIEFAR